MGNYFVSSEILTLYTPKRNSFRVGCRVEISAENKTSCLQILVEFLSKSRHMQGKIFYLGYGSFLPRLLKCNFDPSSYIRCYILCNDGCINKQNINIQIKVVLLVNRIYSRWWCFKHQIMTSQYSYFFLHLNYIFQNLLVRFLLFSCGSRYVYCTLQKYTNLHFASQCPYAF
jgi:hypothetical protein